VQFGRAIAQSRSDFSHHVVDVWFGIDKKIGAPKFRDNVPARDQLFSATNPENQQFHGAVSGVYPLRLSNLQRYAKDIQRLPVVD
jgi:hypothetical protein